MSIYLFVMVLILPFFELWQSKSVKIMNAFGIGVMGLDVSVPCLWVNVLVYQLRITKRPVVVDISWHASGHCCTVI